MDPNTFAHAIAAGAVLLIGIVTELLRRCIVLLSDTDSNSKSIADSVNKLSTLVADLTVEMRVFEVAHQQVDTEHAVTTAMETYRKNAPRAHPAH